MKRIEGKLFNYNELKQRIEAIPRLRDKAFITTCYCTLGRVGEVCYGKLKSVKPIEKSNIVIDQEKKILRITLHTEKVNLLRVVPISMRERDTTKEPPWGEQWITQIIQDYIPECQTEELFDYSSEWGELLFKKYFPESGRNIHSLRKMRATHLRNGEVTGKPIDIQHVANLGGWVNIDVLHRVYSKLSTYDYEKLI